MRRILILIVASLLAVAAPIHAQTTPKAMYAKLQAREQSVRKAIDSGRPADGVRKDVTRVVAGYQSFVGRYPRSSYSDNALWQAAMLSASSYARFHVESDRAQAVSLLKRLSGEYPASPLLRQAKPALARLSGVSDPAQSRRAASPALRPRRALPPAPAPARVVTAAPPPTPEPPIPAPAVLTTPPARATGAVASLRAVRRDRAARRRADRHRARSRSGLQSRSHRQSGSGVRGPARHRRECGRPVRGELRRRHRQVRARRPAARAAPPGSCSISRRPGTTTSSRSTTRSASSSISDRTGKAVAPPGVLKASRGAVGRHRDAGHARGLASGADRRRVTRAGSPDSDAGGRARRHSGRRDNQAGAAGREHGARRDGRACDGAQRGGAAPGEARRRRRGCGNSAGHGDSGAALAEPPGPLLAVAPARARHLADRDRPGTRRARSRREEQGVERGRPRARRRAAAREAAPEVAGRRGRADAPHRRVHSARGAHGDRQP